MESKVILIVGDRNTGKTTDARAIIEGFNDEAIFIHDVSCQFGRPYQTLDEFNNSIARIKNAIILYEEATVFINHAKSIKIAEFLVKSRHDHNTIIFIFHSFRSIPRYIYDMANIIFVHKTKDTFSFIYERFEDEDLCTVFERVKNNPDRYYKEIHAI